MAWMISCKQAIDLISKKEEGKLSFLNRAKLIKHLAVCGICRLFMYQSRMIGKNVSGLEDRMDIKLSEPEKTEIIKTLKNEEKE